MGRRAWRPRAQPEFVSGLHRSEILPGIGHFAAHTAIFVTSLSQRAKNNIFAK
jgi:hypothetical protein